MLTVEPVHAARALRQFHAQTLWTQHFDISGKPQQQTCRVRDALDPDRSLPPTRFIGLGCTNRFGRICSESIDARHGGSRDAHARFHPSQARLESAHFFPPELLQVELFGADETTGEDANASNAVQSEDVHAALRRTAPDEVPA